MAMQDVSRIDYNLVRYLKKYAIELATGPCCWVVVKDGYRNPFYLESDVNEFLKEVFKELKNENE